MDRTPDVRGFVVHLGELQPQPTWIEDLLVDRGDAFPEVLHGLDHVRPGFASCRQCEHVLPQTADEGVLFFQAVVDGRDVAHEYRSATAIGDHRFFDVFHAPILTDGSVGVVALSLGDRARGHVLVLPPQRPFHVAKSQPPGGEQMGVHLDLNFAIQPAVNRNFRNALGPLELRLDVILDKRFQTGDVLPVLRIEDHPGDGVGHVVVGRRHDRLVDFLGIPGHLAQLVRHVAVGDVFIHIDGEFQFDLALALDRGGCQLLQIGDAF